VTGDWMADSTACDLCQTNVIDGLPSIAYGCACSTRSGGLVAAACMLFVLLLSSTVAGLICDDTPGVTMTARHYNFDLEQVPACILHCDRSTLHPDFPRACVSRMMNSFLSLQMPDWSDKSCVDAEETKTVIDAGWPVSTSDNFAITISGTDYDSSVGIVFEVSLHGHGAMLTFTATARAAARNRC
jgi:hypothetical protein